MIDAKEKAPDVQSEAAARAGGSDISITNIIPNNPQIINPFDAIPEELKARPQWIVHDSHKRPYDPRTGSGAKAGKPETWADYKTAVAALMNGGGKYAGIGFEFNDNGLVGIDLDTVRDPQTGEIADDAAAIIQAISSYTEISPSGYGFHIICGIDKLELAWNKLPLAKNNIERPDIDQDTGKQRIDNNGILQFKTPEIEMYTRGRYFTVTGRVWSGLDKIQPRGKAARELHDSYARKFDKFPSSVVARPHSSGNPSGKDYLSIGLEKDASFRALWDGKAEARTGNGSESATDIALMNKLAYWCNCDQDRMVEAFLASPYCEQKDPKHAKKAQRKDYLQRTAARSIRDCAQTAEERDRVYRAGKPPRARKGKPLEEFMREAKPDTNKRYPWNDRGNGYLFADAFKDNARFISDKGKWYIFNGKYWEQDAGELQVMEYAKDLVHEMIFYAMGIKDDNARQDYVEYVNKLNSRKWRETMIKDARSVYPIKFQEFDKKPCIFNCQNGTLNLKTKKFSKHSPSDLLSKISNVNYDPEAKCERWYKFVDEVMLGRKELIRYLQKSLAYALTGDTSLECLFVLYGPTTRNGKGTMMENFVQLMGDYGRTATPEVLAIRKNNDSRIASEDLARLAGSRFVNISEPEKRLTFNVARIKSLTGNDTQNARFLHENSFEFKPTFKFFINTNHLPYVADDTLFSSGRIHVIPFERHFEEHEQDHSLKATLGTPEAISGIFNWYLEGLGLLDKEGLKTPDAVKEATNAYRQESDKIGQFLEECLIRDGKTVLAPDTAFKYFEIWCNQNGYGVDNKRNFLSDLRAKGIVRQARPTGSNIPNKNAIVGYAAPEITLPSGPVAPPPNAPR